MHKKNLVFVDNFVIAPSSSCIRAASLMKLDQEQERHFQTPLFVVPVDRKMQIMIYFILQTVNLV